MTDDTTTEEPVDVAPEAPEAPESPQEPREDPFTHLTPEELAAELRRAQARTRANYAREEAEAAARPILGSLLENLPTPEQIRAAAEKADDEERERHRRQDARGPELRRIREQNWGIRCMSSHARFADAALGNVDPELRPRLVLWLEDADPGMLTLIGGVGSGKTYAAFAVMRERFMLGENVKFWPVPKLLDAWRPNSDIANSSFDEAASVDTLVLDDLGAERPTDWSIERLYILVNDRWMAKRRTVITSNLDIDTFRSSVGERMVSRFAESAYVCDFGMTDRRIA